MDERGVSYLKVIIVLAFFTLLGYVGIKSIIIRSHYESIREKVREEARFAGTYSDKRIRRGIIRRGEEVDVKLFEEEISIARRPGQDIVVRFAYSDSLVLPFYTHYFDFSIDETAPLPR